MPEGHSIRTGVYQWRNVRNGKVYVGSAAVSLGYRERKHREALRRGGHHNAHLQRAWDRDGEESFVFEVLERCLPDDCVAREQHWIDALKAADRRSGYNLNPTAGNRRGAKNSPEHTAAIVRAVKGRKHTEAAKAAIAAAHRGMKASAETRARLSKALRGKRIPAAVRARMAESQRGKIRSAEYRANISAAQRRRVRKLTKDDVLAIDRRLSAGESAAAVARDFSVGASMVGAVKTGRAWGWLTGRQT